MPTRQFERSGTSYGDSSYDRQARAGVSSLRDDEVSARELDAENRDRVRQAAAERHQAYVEAHERQMEAYREAHQRFQEANEERRFQHDMALAKHAETMERETTAALKKISSVDMSKPGAVEQLQKVQGEHPEAFVGPGSIAGLYEDLIDRGMAHQNAREVAAEKAQAKKEVDDAKRAATEGMQKESVTVDGVTYKTPKAAKAVDAEKIRSAFEKSSDAYHAMDDAIIQSGVNPTAAQLDKRNFYRNQMISNGGKLSKVDPDSADEIDKTIKDSVLAEHSALDAKLNDSNTPYEERLKLIPQANALKKILGFEQLNKEGKAVGYGDAPMPAPPSVPPIKDAPKVEAAPPVEPPAATPTEPAAPTPAQIPDAPPAPAPVVQPASPPVPAAPVDPVVSTEAAMPVTQPTPAPVSIPGADTPAPAQPEPHAYEGQRVFKKSLGKYGTIKNGEFVPE